MRRYLCFIALFAFIASAIAGVKVGENFPELTPYKLDGTVPETKGKVIMIDFWASWCDPCKDSFPAMDELQKKFGPEGFVIVAINVDENKSDMEEFIKKNPATFAVVRDGKQKLVDKTGISTMPSSFMVDRTGKVRFAHSGYRGAETKKKYAEEIETLLKEK